MKTIGQRIRELRKAKGYTQADVAKGVGIKAPSVTQWESDKTTPSGKSLVSLASFLETTPDHILYGSEVKEQNAPYSVSSNIELANLLIAKEVPIVSWVQAGERHVAFIEDDPDEIETIKTYVKCSKGTYALRINGESMTTPYGPYSFPEGSVIIVDPEQKGDNTNGIFVIAKKEGVDGVHFKQLKFDGAIPYLNSLNPSDNYPNYYGDFRIIGKVIDFRPVKLP